MILFKLVKKINDNAYQINLIGNSNILATFNVDNLTLYYGQEVLPILSSSYLRRMTHELEWLYMFIFFVRMVA